MKISAIIPIYNGEKYIVDAINSVLHQTLQPKELIIVDDGSTDNSYELVKKIKAAFPIHLIQQKNSGQSAARNRGIQKAEGDFIALLDQDDRWDRRHLEHLAQSFVDHPEIGWAYSNVDHIDEQGRVFKNQILNDCDFSHPQRELGEMLRRDMHILPGATLIRKQALIDVGMFDERLSGYEDDDLFRRLFIKGWKRNYIPESLLQWRIHSHNSGHSTGLKSRKIYCEKIISEFPSSTLFNGFSAAEILGVRFFHTTAHYYNAALKKRDYDKCKSLYTDLQFYLGISPTEFKKSLLIKMRLMKYPKLFNLAKGLFG